MEGSNAKQQSVCDTLSQWVQKERLYAKQHSVCDTLSQWVQKERLYRSEVLLAINDIIDYQ